MIRVADTGLVADDGQYVAWLTGTDPDLWDAFQNQEPIPVVIQRPGATYYGPGTPDQIGDNRVRVTGMAKRATWWEEKLLKIAVWLLVKVDPHR